MINASNYETHAAVLATQWARECGLPPGNLWEPGIVRNMLILHAAFELTKIAMGKDA